MCSVKIILEDDFKEKFHIKEVIKNFTGGQKNVFIVKIGESIQVLKVFKNYGLRDMRELEIYEKYKDNEYLPKIISINEYNNDTIIFEKLIDGDTLEECKDRYAGNDELVIQLIKDIIKVLEPIWTDLIIHRDIKPTNIIIVSGKPHIIDFGIAGKLNGTALTETGFQPGTLKFTSPEQLLGKKNSVSYRSDFFSIGILSYYLYYGKLPFGDNIENIKTMFESGNILYNCDKSCKLYNFFEGVFKLKPHLRPGKPNLLLNLLP